MAQGLPPWIDRLCNAGGYNTAALFGQKLSLQVVPQVFRMAKNNKNQMVRKPFLFWYYKCTSKIFMEPKSSELEKENLELASLIKGETTNLPKTKEKNPQQDYPIPLSASFLIQMVDFIKNTLSSIRQFNHLSIHKFDDPEFRMYARKTITQEIKRIDSVLNALLNFININTPIIKKNTIQLIIDDLLEANETQIEEKDLKIIRKFEEDLPETHIHDEQVKFILNSIIQYLVLTVPSHSTVVLSTRSKILQKPSGDEKIVTLKERQYIEILIASMTQDEPFEQLEDIPEVLSKGTNQTTNLLLNMINELVRKYQGIINFEVRENGIKTLISLQLPVERRQVILYEQVKL
jgi:hypothetical protein